MPTNTTDYYDNLLNKCLYKQALDFLKNNPQIDNSDLYFELKNFRNLPDSLNIAKKLYKDFSKKIKYQINKDISNLTKPIHNLNQKAIAKFYFQHFENKN
jgi:hypothetical protein